MTTTTVEVEGTEAAAVATVVVLAVMEVAVVAVAVAAENAVNDGKAKDVVEDAAELAVLQWRRA